MPNPQSQQPSAQPASSADDLTPGAELGDFRIVRQIGRGGMGVVYEAHQVSLKRRVALKVLPFAATLDSQQLRRFQNEAQAAAALHHANIVPVFATGCERGVHYFAMQFIEGDTLATTIAQRRRSLRAGRAEPPRPDAYFRAQAELVAQAASALEHAHQQGVVHRDVKPANLMLDDRGQLWVLDFGLAQWRDERAVTQADDVLGTVRYVSPEQVEGRGATVGPAADVHALGVVLYELLTLEQPFAGKSLLATLEQIRTAAPKSLGKLAPGLPRDLETICLTCLRKNPRQRYRSAALLASDLRRFLTDQPIAARRPSRAARLLQSARARPTLAAATATVLVSLLLMVLFWPWRQTAPLKMDVERAEITKTEGESMGNLQRIGEAMYEYHQEYHRLPPRAICDQSSGKPLLSWRVALLPYFERPGFRTDRNAHTARSAPSNPGYYYELYRDFRLNESWDSPHNLQLLKKIPSFYADPSGGAHELDHTFYQVCAGPGTPFEEPHQRVTFSELVARDGFKNTLLVVEAAHPVPWTKPDDLPYLPDGPLPALGGVSPLGICAVFADKSTKCFKPTIRDDPATLRAIFGWRDGDVVDLRPHLKVGAAGATR